MDTPHLSDNENGELNNDFTVVDLHSSGDEEQREITAEELFVQEPEDNPIKTLDGKTGAFSGGFQPPDDSPVNDTDKLCVFDVKEADMLFQTEHNISLDEEDTSKVLHSSPSNVSVSEVSDSVKSMIFVSEPTKKDPIKIQPNPKAPFPAKNVLQILKDHSDQTITGTGQTVARVFIKPIGPKDSGPVLIHSSNSVSIGPVMVNESDKNKINTPLTTINSVLKKTPQFTSVKTPRTTRYVYVNPPPGAKIIFPQSTSQQRQVLIPAKTSQVQGQVLLPVSAPQGQILMPTNTSQGKNQVLVPAKVSSSHILVPTSSSHGQVLVPASSSQGQVLVPAQGSQGQVLVPAQGSQGQVLVPAQGQVLFQTSSPKGQIFIPNNASQSQVLVPVSSSKSQVLVPVSSSQGQILVPTINSPSRVVVPVSSSQVLAPAVVQAVGTSGGHQLIVTANSVVRPVQKVSGGVQSSPIQLSSQYFIPTSATASTGQVIYVPACTSLPQTKVVQSSKGGSCSQNVMQSVPMVKMSTNTVLSRVHGNPQKTVPKTIIQGGKQIIVSQAAVSGVNGAPQKLVSQTMVRTPLNSFTVAAKPGQIVLQTADGQRLLLQPIEPGSGKPVTNVQPPTNLVFKQGKIKAFSELILQKTLLNLNSSKNPMVAYTTSSVAVAPKIGVDGQVQTFMKSPNKLLTPVGKPAAIKSDMLTYLPHGDCCSQKMSMTLKINIENDKGEVKKTIQNQVELDTVTLLKKKSVLLDILTKESKTMSDNIDDNIEVLEIQNTDLIQRAAKSNSKKELYKSNFSKLKLPADKTKTKLPEGTGIGGMTYFKKSVNVGDDVACYLPLHGCGSETIEHLISLTQTKNGPNPAIDANSGGSHPSESGTFHDTYPNQAYVNNLLKTSLPLKQTWLNNVNRRKQVLTNRAAEPEQTFVLPTIKRPPPNPKRHLSPMKRYKPRPYPIESDEVISSLTDSDFQRDYFVDVCHVDPTTLSLSLDANNVHIKSEPLSPQADNIYVDHNDNGNQISVDGPVIKYEIVSCNKRKSVDSEIADPKRIKKESEEDAVLTPEDLGCRSYQVFINPHQDVHLESLNKQNEFIPLTSFLQNNCDAASSSATAQVKMERLDDEDNYPLELSELEPEFDPDASFDYSNIKGPISVNIGSNMKMVKDLMGLGDLHIQSVPDFRIIESRFAINGLRHVYSCLLCKGEYATVKLSSIGEHLEMHRKFPKIHRLLSERPYEVTALTGNEVSAIVAGAESLNEYELKKGKKCVFSNNKIKFMCTLCPYVARSTANLQSHMNVHTMASRVACDICNVVYRNYKVIEAHKTNEHKSDLKKMIYISARPL